MGTCKSCKYWEFAEHGGGICSNEKFREYCGYESDALVYSYSEGGRFWTGPDFGCVHHKAK